MAFNLDRVKGLCFDIDGTISDTDDAWVEKLTSLFQPVRFLFRKGDVRHFARWLVMVTESPMNLVYYWADSLSMDDNFARLFERISRGRKRAHAPFMLMKGARELLDAAHSRYPLTVVTARDAASSSRFLEQFSLGGCFQQVVSALTCEHTKPYPEPVQFAASSMNLDAQDCVMIGDTTVDILAGKRAGAQTVGLLCGFGTEDELRKAGADVILNDLAELKALLQL